jgi:hypothetical protein
MDNKTITIVILGVISILLLILYVAKPCPCVTEEYVDGLKILEERIISKTITPVNYEKLNGVVASYTTCPAEMDCEITDTSFINIYGDYTEEEKIILISQITTALYEEIPFLYDRTLGFTFRDQNQEIIDKIYVDSNKWSRD